GRPMPYAHAAALVAVHLLVLLTLAPLSGDLLRLGIHLDDVLLWPALAAAAAALILGFWDPEAVLWGLPVGPLYTLALCAIFLGLHQQVLAPRDLLWEAALAVGGFLAAARLVARSVAQAAALARCLGFGPSAAT